MFTVWRVYGVLSPNIQEVQLDSDGRLVIAGSSFGGAAGHSQLVYGPEDNPVPVNIVEWRDHRVVATAKALTSGRVTLKRSFWFLSLADSASVSLPPQDLPSEPFGYQVPVQAAAPWPLFRRDHRNTGRSTLQARYDGSLPWAFQTGGSVSSTPVIDKDGIAYFGSGDRTFYAVAPDGSQVWSYATGGVIDSAAALLSPSTVVVPSADGNLYGLSTASEGPRQLWAFEAPGAPSSSGKAFHAAVAVGYDGTIYAGNTNLSYYALLPWGQLKWTYRTNASARSMAAFGANGRIFWGSNDAFVHAVGPDGSDAWTKRTLGIIGASAAVGNDGTVYIGSFDSHLYALTGDSGSTQWTFKTNDHVHAAVAIGEGADGRTDGIYFGSMDGRFYALDAQGSLKWMYDTGDPIRSSAAIGMGPSSESPPIVYFGGGDGKLYALDAASGRRRWSFDTTPTDLQLRDRNDLNSSVALGANGVYVGSESGALWYVPYDYCLHAEDPRCSVVAGEDLPEDLIGLAYVSPGGTTHFSDPPPISPASVISLRLVSRGNGATDAVHFCNTPLLCSVNDIRIEVEPPFDFRLEVPGNGQHLYIVPTEFLQPDTAYRLRVQGVYYSGGFQIGNLTIGGRTAGTLAEELILRTDQATPSLPVRMKDNEVPAFEWTRLAVPIPPMLASLNQAPFDASSWIMSVIYNSPPRGEAEGRFVVWGIGARHDDEGTLIPDPDPRLTLTLNGRYAGNNFILDAHDFTWSIADMDVPVDTYELRGQMDAEMRVRPGATFFAKAHAWSFPGLGPYLMLGGLTSNAYDELLMSGTYVTRPYPSAAPANKRPGNLKVVRVERVRPTDSLPGQVVVDFGSPPAAAYRVDKHRIGIVLIDRHSHHLLPLDYANGLCIVENTDGTLAQAVLTLPAGTFLPLETELLVIADAFPLHRATLRWVSPKK
jgi:outer membrane protein assembly factor BamB